MKHAGSASTLKLLASVVALKKRELLGSTGGLLPFTRWYFPLREGMEFIEGPHHRIIGETLDRVLRMELPRVIITLPPGYTKTEMAVINFVAKGFQLNPGARFIHASFSDQRALENSQLIKELVEMPDYQDMLPKERQFAVAADSKAKDRWKTTAGGGMLAKAAGGPITGFRAGTMDKTRFTGALIIDDPLKPDDAFSPAKRDAVNRRATNTFRSRLAHEDVPIVVIMQRLHSNDFVGHLLTGGSGDKWHHLDLPVLIESADQDYPKEWTHGIPIPHNLPCGPLWAEKHDLNEIEVLKADMHTYNSQYRQRPTSVEGALFDMAAFRYWAELPPMEYFMMYGDTAQKTAERNDYSVLQLWGKAKDRSGIFLVDQMRGKWEAPELKRNVAAFWGRYTGMGIHPRALKVEDKSSGTGLIQDLGRKGIPILPIPRERDKYMRGLDAAPWIASGHVYLPANAPFIYTLCAELQTFDGLGTGHDDQVDPLMDAVSEMLSGSHQINLDNL